MVKTVEERLWRERAVEKGFAAGPMTISCLLNSEVHSSEDVMSKSFPQNTMIPGSETQDPEGPRKAAPNIKTREWLGERSENSNDAERR